MSLDIDTSWSQDGKHRVQVWKRSEQIEEGDTVTLEEGPLEFDFTCTGTGEEFGEGSYYAYGEIDLSGIVDFYASQVPSDGLTDEMRQMARQNLPEFLTDDEKTEVINRLDS